METLLRWAVVNQTLVAFVYKGHRRVIEPHVIGWHKDALQLLGYQIGGESLSGGLPSWRRFDVADMHLLLVLHETFAAPRPSFSVQRSRFDTVLASTGELSSADSPLLR